MHFLPSFLTILTIVLALTPCSHAKEDMKEFFTKREKRYFPERDDRNGCKKHVPHLEASYAEAAKLIGAAQEALKDLQTVRSTTDDDAAERWNVRARTIKAMFGIEMDSTTGGAKNDVDNRKRWTEVVSIFDKMAYGMEYDYTGTVARKPALYCGIDGWKYLQPGDPNPALPGTLLSDKKKLNGQEAFPNGAHYFNGVFTFTSKSGKHQGAPGPCSKPTVLASTNAKNDMITWCDISKLVARRVLPSSSINDGDQLDQKERKTMSKTWVHELAHFYGSHTSGLTGGVKDQEARDDAGALVTPSRGSYGIKYVLNLAKHDASLATRNADGYAWFAIAMYLKGYDWSIDGKAKKVVTKNATP